MAAKEVEKVLHIKHVHTLWVQTELDTVAELYDKELIEDLKTNTKKYQEKVFVKQLLGPYRGYLKTRYCKEFIGKLAYEIRYQESNEFHHSGVSGIGKTCSILHFVFSNIFNKSKNYLDIVYIDVNEVRYCIEIGGLANERLNTFFNGLNQPFCVIIDHVTSRVEKVLSAIGGECYVHLIDYITSQVKADKKLLIYTGFTSGIFQGNTCAWSKRFALSEEEFTRIWFEKSKLVENAEDSSVFYDAETFKHTKDQCKTVYWSLQDFAITPGLAHFAFDYLFGNLKYDDAHVNIAYLNKLRKDVDNFPSIGENNQEDIAELVKETSMIAEIIKKGGIFPLESFDSKRCPVNIFTYEMDTATREDCEKNPAFLMHEMSEGQRYVKLSFIQNRPSHIDRWMKKLTILPKHIAQFSVETLQRHMKSLVELAEKVLIESQLEKHLFFIPNDFTPTSYIKTTRNITVNLEHLRIITMLAKQIIATDEQMETITVDKKYKGQLKNVALRTKFLIKDILKGITEPKLMYPNLLNFLGFGYFLYIPSRYRGSETKKYNNALILFQVTIGQSHGAKTVAAALDCIKEVIASELHGNDYPFTIDVHDMEKFDIELNIYIINVWSKLLQKIMMTVIKENI
ncbi:hypothetical protein KUTeg_018376 [Tegillarca granosa]|uniref:Uncharacterized protein n=1 Tax=Tegillarca granosa TaxID=220873 RepID=A0ABQ9EHQ1_TEGGR|nr:hypothetical protein KUTeg_018376 [Tegillarca granosa]